MPKKRKSGGRTKGKRGQAKMVQCSACGSMVPRDKAKKYTTFSSGIDYRLAQEIKADGGYIPRKKKVAYYCISCAIHKGKVNIRSKNKRRRKR